MQGLRGFDIGLLKRVDEITQVSHWQLARKFVWLYCTTEIVFTSLTPISTRSCARAMLNSSCKISSYS